ncbi:MAG TPA: hypothetical protein VI911_09430 [Patescibacteria group bacterium]|nr:MAG: hypothetical protein UR43_C0005G0132 [candidate division TM6 bacterium GW2011_GWF2_33_332]HLD91219.1 hypothetical protein [Patescibacteria group bacterium]
MKIFELAKELGLKGHELLNLIKENDYGYTAITQTLDVDDENKFRNEFKDVKKEVTIEEIKEEVDPEIKEHDKIEMVGIYYDYKRKKYIPITMIILPEQFETLNVVKNGEYNTIYNAKSKMGELSTKAKFFNPSTLERLIDKRRLK